MTADTTFSKNFLLTIYDNI